MTALCIYRSDFAAALQVFLPWYACDVLTQGMPLKHFILDCIKACLLPCQSELSTPRYMQPYQESRMLRALMQHTHHHTLICAILLSFSISYPYMQSAQQTRILCWLQGTGCLTRQPDDKHSVHQCCRYHQACMLFHLGTFHSSAQLQTCT